MAFKRKLDGVTMSVDMRSIKTFKRNVDALVTATGEFAKEDLMDFCEDVLMSANEMVPIDTGTLADSAGYKVEKHGKGYRARMGYGVVRDKVNPRTGKRASQYAGIVHESYHYTPSYDAPRPNGQGKFFEKALALHTGEFVDKVGDSLRDILQMPKLHPAKLDRKFKSEESQAKFEEWLARATSGKALGFTARHKGKILPYPLNDSKAAKKVKQKKTKKTAQSTRAKVRNKYMRKKQQGVYGYKNLDGDSNYTTRGSYGTAARVKKTAKKSKHYAEYKEEYNAALAKKIRKKKKK